MVRIPTIKIALVCAGLLIFGQPAEASLYKMGSRARESLLRLMHRYHNYRATAHKAKMRYHDIGASAAKRYADYPHMWREEAREFVGEALVRAGARIGLAGLVTYGVTGNFSQEKIVPQVRTAVDSSLKLGGGMMGLGALLYHPGAALAAMGLFGASYGLYQFGVHQGMKAGRDIQNAVKKS